MESQKIRIFLSSTYTSLRNERKAAEDVIQRMDLDFIGMEHFGSFPQTPLKESLARVSTADILILIVGFEHGHIPRGRRRSFIELEYLEALRLDIPVLGYIADSNTYPKFGVISPRIINFRKALREKRGAQFFTSPKDLARQVAADISRLLRALDTRLMNESKPKLIKRHHETLKAMIDGEYQKAKQINEKILDTYQYSPRAHYNHACILTRLAEGYRIETERNKLLEAAAKYLNIAVEYGIIDLILLHDQPPVDSNNTSEERIIKDPDLKYLFEWRPSLSDRIKQKKSDLRQGGGRGCFCDQTQVLLSNGAKKKIGEIEIGEAVACWDQTHNCRQTGTVEQINRIVVEQAVMVNDLVCTATHPFLTTRGWIKACDLRHHDKLITVHGDQETVKRIGCKSGIFSVVDISVIPFKTFIVENIIVHNKWYK